MNSDSRLDTIVNRPANGQHFDSMADEQIIECVLKGDVHLFEVIVQRYNQQLFRIVRSYLSDEADVKDVMQTAYLKAFKNLKQFRAESRFSTWLIRIVINEALKVVNRKKTMAGFRAVTREADSDLINGTEESTPESDAIYKDMNQFLEQAIDRLPPVYRSVLIMREIEQMSTKETADCLNISPANVKVRLHRAKTLLRSELEKAIGTGDLFTFRGAQCDIMTEQVMRKIRLAFPIEHGWADKHK